MSESLTTEKRGFQPGDRVIYMRFQRPYVTEWPAAYVRCQFTSGRLMHVIRLDATPEQPRQVGADSIRKA